MDYLLWYNRSPHIFPALKAINMYFELIPYLRGLWRRSLAKVLCYFGHHDYETEAVFADGAQLSCFYCEKLKTSYMSRPGEKCICQSDDQEDDCSVHGIDEYAMKRTWCISTLNSFRPMQDDWDDGGAIAPSSISIDKAIDIVKCITPDYVDMDVMGGIALYYYGDKHLWIHIKNDGRSVLTVM
jgi:hypothetical protein